MRGRAAWRAISNRTDLATFWRSEFHQTVKSGLRGTKAPSRVPQAGHSTREARDPVVSWCLPPPIPPGGSPPHWGGVGTPSGVTHSVHPWSSGRGARSHAALASAGVASEVRGVIAPGKGQAVRIETVVVPDPGPGEALVSVQACGVCHTDLHYREGGIGDDFPYLLGHEAAGTVDAVGPDVTAVEPGDF